MQKTANIISYYINGKLISSNNLRQPLDALTTESLATAIGIVINAHVNGNIKIKNGTARVTQGATVLKEYTVHLTDEPP